MTCSCSYDYRVYGAERRNSEGRLKRGSEGGVVGRKDGVGRWGRGMGEGEMRKGGRLKRRGGRGEVVEERWGGEMGG